MMKQVLKEIVIPAMLDRRKRYLEKLATCGQELRKGPAKAAEPCEPAAKPMMGLSFDGEAAFFNAAIALLQDAETGPILKKNFVLFK